MRRGPHRCRDELLPAHGAEALSVLVTPRVGETIEPEAGRLSSPDPEFFTAIGAAMLPGIQSIAREIAQHEGERRLRVDDLTPASCDDPV